MYQLINKNKAWMTNEENTHELMRTWDVNNTDNVEM